MKSYKYKYSGLQVTKQNVLNLYHEPLCGVQCTCTSCGAQCTSSTLQSFTDTICTYTMQILYITQLSSYIHSVLHISFEEATNSQRKFPAFSTFSQIFSLLTPYSRLPHYLTVYRVNQIFPQFPASATSG